MVAVLQWLRAGASRLYQICRSRMCGPLLDPCLVEIVVGWEGEGRNGTPRWEL